MRRLIRIIIALTLAGGLSGCFGGYGPSYGYPAYGYPEYGYAPYSYGYYPFWGGGYRPDFDDHRAWEHHHEEGHPEHFFHGGGIGHFGGGRMGGFGGAHFGGGHFGGGHFGGRR